MSITLGGAALNKDKRNTQTPTFPQRGKKYTALFDLQDFLEKEVEDASPGAFYRSFTPITDGLGLESPRTKDTFVEQEVPPSAPPVRTPVRQERRMDISMLFDEPALMAAGEKTPKVSDIIAGKDQPDQEATSGVPVSAILDSMVSKTLGNEANLKSVIANDAPSIDRSEETSVPTLKRTAAVPPKMPRVTALRRLLSMLVDQLFVLTLWAIAIVITSNALNGFQSGFSMDIMGDFSNPSFQRFAILEFSALWIAYFAISLGVLDLTFGMWVWGLRVSYGSTEDSQYWMRRMMRVIWSFFFFAPIFPALLLVFRRKGRNLLDVLSGTNLYVAG